MLYYLCSMKTLNGIFCGKLTTFLMLCSMLGILVSCTSVDDNSGGVSPQYTGMPRVIYDTDLGSSTDDLIALRLLYNYAKEGRCKLLGIVVDREGEDCAAVADEFTPSPTGNCRYQKPASEAWFKTMLDKMRVIGRP